MEGIVRTDTDHWVLRYKTSLDNRDFQIIMLVEVKEYGKEPDPSQLDILHFAHWLMTEKGKNRHGARTWKTIKAKSVTGRPVKVKSFGVHLLQFERTSPDDGWVKWDRKIIDKNVLLGILALERRPDDPSQMMIAYLRDRHLKKFRHQLALFGQEI